MNFACKAFSHFIRSFAKISYCIICTNLLFSHSLVYAGSPFKNDQDTISCNITEQFITIKNARTTFRIDRAFHLDVLLSNNGQSYVLTKDNVASSVLSIHSNNRIISFTRKVIHINEINTSKFGKGKIVKVEGLSSDGKLICNLSFEAYYNFPNVILVQSSIKNTSGKNYFIQDYTLNHLYLHSTSIDKKWWTFQGASYYWQQDFAFQLPDTFTRSNYMGLNDTRVGSGIPLVNVWNKEYGLALAYLGAYPRDLYLPVKNEYGDVQLAIKEGYKNEMLKPNGSLVSPLTAIIVHQNDFYDALKAYSKLMKPFLPAFKKPVDYAYQSEWCTWGYKQDFTPELVLNKLEHLKAIGMKSVILDDGWSLSHGDWVPNPAKFPNGDEDFKRLVNAIHVKDMKVWIWWLPGYVDSTSQIATQHADWLIKNKDGSVHSSYALCPAYLPVQEHYKQLVKKFVADYKLNGLKLDFQEINSAPPCYNPAHHHKDPLESYYATPTLFKNIYETAIHYNPDMLIEYCSCSIPPSIFHLPWTNLAVTSDPAIWQISQRIKMYKALMGDDFPVLEEYCGVIGGPVYPLTIGTGGVPGTFSTYLDDYHKNWIAVYQKHELSKDGQYLNLYDFGFDYPETHVIKKDSKFYYAFYTHPWTQLQSKVYRFGPEPFDGRLEGKNEFQYPIETYSGKIEFRGLDKTKKYKVIDYSNNKELGIINGRKPYLNMLFDNYLLVEVAPISNQ